MSARRLPPLINGWSPYSSSTRNETRTCQGCGNEKLDLSGWFWRWEEHEGQRRSVSLCGQCFSRITRPLKVEPSCERCGSLHLVYDTVGQGLTRVTCEICAWHKEGVQIPSRFGLRVELEGAS